MDPIYPLLNSIDAAVLYDLLNGQLISERDYNLPSGEISFLNVMNRLRAFGWPIIKQCPLGVSDNNSQWIQQYALDHRQPIGSPELREQFMKGYEEHVRQNKVAPEGEKLTFFSSLRKKYT